MAPERRNEIPPEFDPARPLQRRRWEVVAQRMAMGDNNTKAYKAAGYGGADVASQASKLLRRHPMIGARADFLANRSFDTQVGRTLLTDDRIINGLIENIESAKTANPIYKRARGKDPVVIGYKRNHNAINTAYKTLAEIKGMLIRKSETKHGKLDPIEDATPKSLIALIGSAVQGLGLEFDAEQFDRNLRRQLGEDEEPPGDRTPNGSDEPGEAGVLPPTSEADGVLHGGSEIQAPAADGWEPAGEI